jgi:aspartate carbamoyltransferase
MQHILSAQQFKSQAEINDIMTMATLFKNNTDYSSINTRLANKIVATVFFEPSTRTRLSFETAVLRLGGKVISCENAQTNTSAAKGETIEDTARVLAGYADLMIIRHPEKNSVARAASVSDIPVINAGDGIGEHPTQGLLDIFTIIERFGSIDNLTLTFVGDLKNGRTLHSTIQLAALYDSVTINLVSPASLTLPAELITKLTAQGCIINQLQTWDSCLAATDVLYMTRIQKERFTDIRQYNQVKNHYILTNELANKMKYSSIIMHPLPRVNEIEPEVDTNHRAYYFEQGKNGVYLRMALLTMLLNPLESINITLLDKQKVSVLS